MVRKNRNINIIHTTGLRFLLTVLMFISFSLISTTFSHAQAGGGEEVSGGGSVKEFAVRGYSFQGEYLVIDYYVPFPGMTKVWLYQEEDMLWRSQYVNEKGDHKLILRASKLNPGSGYTFAFSYKNEKRNLPVVAR